MAYPYFPHVTEVVITINVKGHQMESVSQSITMDKERHGSELCKETADAVMSIIGMASEIARKEFA